MPNDPVVVEAHYESETAIELKEMIGRTINTMERNKVEKKKMKEMIESVLLNDELFRVTKEQASDAKKKNDKEKLRLLENKATSELVEKVKDITAENKELKVALGEYVREYAKITGKTKIEIADGREFNIIPSYQLIFNF